MTKEPATMRIIATSDLHYNILRSRAPTEAVAAEMLRAGGDVLLLLGDLAGVDLSVLERAFALFDGFRGPRLYVPGNHEMWVAPGGDSLERYTRELPELCRRCGVHLLDEAPYVDGDVAIVGNVGWYDYTFRPADLGIPLRFYEHKVAPGTAELRAEFQHLLADPADVAESSRRLLCRWMDGQHVRLPMRDLDFAERTAARLRSDLERARDKRRVVVGLHHVPFAALVPPPRNKALSFATAFLGSELYGDMVLEYENVRDLLCGHSHWHARTRRGHLTAESIGSTYVAKRIVVVDC